MKYTYHTDKTLCLLYKNYGIVFITGWKKNVPTWPKKMSKYVLKCIQFYKHKKKL